MHRYRQLLWLAAFAAGKLVAQTPNPLSAEVKWSYETIKNNLLRLAEKMPAEYYTFRPTPDIDSSEEIVGDFRLGKLAK